MSGGGLQQDKARAISAGFDAHLTSPSDPAGLASLRAFAEARDRATS